MSAERSPDANEALALAQRIAETASRVLGEGLLSVVLHGSLTFDDYLPGHSDIDLLAIVDHTLDNSQIDSLTRAVTAERAQTPAWVLSVGDAQLARWLTLTDDAPHAAQRSHGCSGSCAHASR